MIKPISFSLAVVMLVSFCFNAQAQTKSTSKTKTTATSSKTKAKVKTEKAPDEAAGTTVKKWSASERATFVKSCVDGLGWSKDSSEAYCNCAADKVEKMYPTAADVEKLTDAQATDMAKECLKLNSFGTTWTESERKTFMDNCVGKTEEEKAGGANDGYCKCMLDKIEKLYPNPIDAGNITSEQMTTWAKECKK